jgi:hypothetical protein
MESNQYRRILETWGYVVEIIAATLSLIALLLWFGEPSTELFFHSSVGDFASYFSAAVLAGGFAMLGILFSKTETNFGKWLHNRGAFAVFSRSYFVVIIISIISIIGLIFCKNAKFIYSGTLGSWFIIYTAINGYTLAKNSYDLIMLIMAFNNKRTIR